MCTTASTSLVRTLLEQCDVEVQPGRGPSCERAGVPGLVSSTEYRGCHQCFSIALLLPHGHRLLEHKGLVGCPSAAPAVGQPASYPPTHPTFYLPTYLGTYRSTYPNMSVKCESLHKSVCLSVCLHCLSCVNYEVLFLLYGWMVCMVLGVCMDGWYVWYLGYVWYVRCIRYVLYVWYAGYVCTVYVHACIHSCEQKNRLLQSCLCVEIRKLTWRILPAQGLRVV